MSTDTLTQGRRVHSYEEFYGEDRQPGDYWLLHQQDGTDVLHVILPDGGEGGCHDHTILEHADGTVTVTPSIHDAPHGWHGFLDKGVWREV